MSIVTLHARRRLGILALPGIAALVGLEIWLRQRAQTRIAEVALSARRPSGAAWADELRSTRAVQIVCLGDSIVAGHPGPQEDAWPALLAARLNGSGSSVRWNVVNAGSPGDTVALGWQRFERQVAARGPDVVMIAFGLNDCSEQLRELDTWYEDLMTPLFPDSYLPRALRVRVARSGRKCGLPAAGALRRCTSGQPRTSARGFERGLGGLVQACRGVGAFPVLLTMTPLAEGAPATHGGRARYAAYNSLIRQVARMHGVTLVDLEDSLASGILTDDGIHLTGAGQAWIASQVHDQLAPLWSRNAPWSDQ
jgi:lysophospholipase L1-like esterase